MPPTLPARRERNPRKAALVGAGVLALLTGAGVLRVHSHLARDPA